MNVPQLADAKTLVERLFLFAFYHSRVTGKVTKRAPGMIQRIWLSVCFSRGDVTQMVDHIIPGEAWILSIGSKAKTLESRIYET